ncbi:MAG: hypothetical protein JST83_13335 [Bacteroidetes bacterium]|nr:hypothetical protein [Bacteroidota bacterium]
MKSLVSKDNPEYLLQLLIAMIALALFGLLIWCDSSIKDIVVPISSSVVSAVAIYFSYQSNRRSQEIQVQTTISKDWQALVRQYSGEVLRYAYLIINNNTSRGSQSDHERDIYDNLFKLRVLLNTDGSENELYEHLKAFVEYMVKYKERSDRNEYDLLQKSVVDSVHNVVSKLKA